LSMRCNTAESINAALSFDKFNFCRSVEIICSVCSK
jgi:hypothetical protein